MAPRQLGYIAEWYKTASLRGVVLEKLFSVESLGVAFFHPWEMGDRDVRLPGRATRCVRLPRMGGRDVRATLLGDPAMGNIPLHPYDGVMLVILAAATFFGLWKGLAWQVASVASFVLSYVVAVQASSWLAPLLPWPAPWNSLAAMLILFVATSAAVWVVFRLVAGLIDTIQLKAFDRQLGALLGLFKGVLICLIITFFAVTLSEVLRQEVLRARSGYYIALLIDRLKPVLPTEVRNLVGQYIEELDRKLHQPSTPPHQENLPKQLENLQNQVGGEGPTAQGLQSLGSSGTPLLPNWPAVNR